MIRPAAAVARWLRDPRTDIAVALSLLVAAVIASVLIGGVTTHEALDAQHRTSTAASRRIDLLNDQIRSLAEKADSNSRLLGEAVGEITALQEQVRQLGGKPVVVNVTTSTTATPPPRPTASPSTTTTSQPPSTTTTTTPCLLNAGGRCVRASHGP